jgi:hypothetical protein
MLDPDTKIVALCGPELLKLEDNVFLCTVQHEQEVGVESIKLLCLQVAKEVLGEGGMSVVGHRR